MGNDVLVIPMVSPIDINATPVTRRSTGTLGKRSRVVSPANLTDARNLYGGMPTPTPDNPNYYYDLMEEMINVGGQGIELKKLKDNRPKSKTMLTSRKNHCLRMS